MLFFEACVNSYCPVVWTPMSPDCAFVKKCLIEGMHAVIMDMWSAPVDACLKATSLVL
jgi:hypothetical protein